MKFSLFYLPTYFPEIHGTEQNLYNDMLEEIIFADKTGFHSVWFAEHHFYAYGGIIPSVPLMGMAVATQTKNIRIGSGVALLPLNDPIRLAEQFAMLDVFSNGRLEFGIGRAFQKPEYQAFNVPMSESRERFNEAHEIIMLSWLEERFSFKGKFRELHNLRVLPKPIQSPHPPISVACVLSQESFEWTGKHGYNLMYVPYVFSLEDSRQRISWYKNALSEAGHDASKREIMLVYHCYVGETLKQAQDYPKPYILRYMQTASEPNQEDAYSKDYQNYSGLGKLFGSIDYDFLYPDRVIFGDPKECIRRIKEIEDLGATHISLVVNFGGIDHKEVMESLERFVKEVMPHFQ